MAVKMITESEKKLSYAKYWYRDMVPVPQYKLKIAGGPACDPSKALTFENSNDFICGKDVGIEMGFCVMEDGTGFVANATLMPGVTPAMFDWWFPWHSLEDLRYKIWDKEDHYYARADRREYVLDKSIPNSQKTWGVNHDVFEDVGMGPQYIKICFKCPSDLGFDLSKVGTKGCAAMVCAVIEGLPVLMAHICEELEGGINFRSRFWMGYGLVSGQLVKVLQEGEKIPEALPRGLFAHNIKEYSNLASFLPEIYEEEKDNW